MQLTADISLYPLQEDYIPPIDSFIADLNNNPELTVVTNAMSTQVVGEFDAVFAAVKAALASSAERFGQQVLVCKFIPAALPIKDWPNE